MKAQKLILTLCILAGISLSCGDDDTPENTRAANFEFFWETVNREYSYFELKGVDWDDVRSEFEPQVTENLTNRQFFDILSAMILRLEDGHSALRTSIGNAFFRGYRGEVDNSAVNRHLYIENVAANNNRYTIGDVIGKNLRYIGVHSLSGDINDSQFDALYASVSTFNDYDGLIIDLRNNGGGNDGIARRFVQGFISQESDFRRFRFRQPGDRNSFTSWNTDTLVPENSVNFTKPIVVLTNRFVVSSAEGFTLMLKSLSNVTILGDTTAGSTGNPGLFEMPNGWELLVSRWQATDPEGNYVEGNGIAPHQVLWISEEDREAGRDTILEAAIASFN